MQIILIILIILIMLIILIIIDANKRADSLNNIANIIPRGCQQVP